nr:hypothetical protein [bacterium]
MDNLFTGFTLSGTKADYTGNTINADGSTDVAIYYTRNSHNVRYAYENADSLTSIPSALPEEKSYKYGQNVSVAYDATAS